MKRFWLFAGDGYYPLGGFDDFIESFDTFEQAMFFARGCNRDWWHIVDRDTGDSWNENGPVNWRT
jgi:hypothetical protein